MGNVLQIKVSLKGIKPMIWRRFLVKEDISFYELGHAIIHMMGWHGGHLSSFSKGRNLTIDMPNPMGDFDDSFGALNAESVKINEILNAKGDTIEFTYDFGDNWDHKVLVEKVLPLDAKIKYPICIAGKRSCPPEDCGGPWGYPELLEAISNKKHPEHEEVLEWVGEDFDPEYFSVDDVNAGY